LNKFISKLSEVLAFRIRFLYNLKRRTRPVQARGSGVLARKNNKIIFEIFFKLFFSKKILSELPTIPVRGKSFNDVFHKENLEIWKSRKTFNYIK